MQASPLWWEGSLDQAAYWSLSDDNGVPFLPGNTSMVPSTGHSESDFLSNIQALKPASPVEENPNVSLLYWLEIVAAGARDVAI